MSNIVMSTYVAEIESDVKTPKIKSKSNLITFTECKWTYDQIQLQLNLDGSNTTHFSIHFFSPAGEIIPYNLPAITRTAYISRTYGWSLLVRATKFPLEYFYIQENGYLSICTLIYNFLLV